MDTGPPPSPPRRRHGAALEAAILDAGWDELRETGYARLTMASVAARARTSEPVLYRRWPNKDRLVLAVFDRRRSLHPITAPDTGTLRGDLIAHLTVVAEALAGYLTIVVAATFAGLAADTGMTPAQMREQAMGDEADPRRRAVYRHAIARGELDPVTVPRAVLALPFDLMRHDMLMDLAPPRPARIRSIVDDLFLPLLRSHQGG